MIKPQGLQHRSIKDLQESASVYSMHKLYPTKVEYKKRYFININSAQYPVLVALLTDLRGYYIDSESVTKELLDRTISANRIDIRKNKYNPIPFGKIRRTTPITVEVAGIISRKIMVERAVKGFKNFYGKNSWNEFVYRLYKENVIDFYQGEVLKANFNPNTNSYIWNADAPLRYLVDKFSLDTYSYEFSFVSGGYFTMESIGDILAGDRISKLLSRSYMCITKDNIVSSMISVDII